MTASVGWRVPRLWPSERVVCIAAGPGLCREDVERVRGRARVIAINWMWHWAPWADCLYACDREWWRSEEAPGPSAGPALKVGLEATERTDVRVLDRLKGEAGMVGLSSDPGRLQTGQNSGHQAINLAAHLVGPGGEIILLGYAFQFSGDGRRHCHPDHRPELGNPEMIKADGAPGAVLKWRAWAETIPPAAEAMGVTIVNASRETALTCFPRRRLEDIFP